MAKNRDSWDKLNRQRKIWDARGPGNGPAPITATVQRLLKANAIRANLELQERRALARGFSVSGVFRQWLEENQVDVAKVENAVRSSLCNDPIHETSTPIIFWKHNQAAEEARKIADFTATPSSRLAAWLLKFKESA